MGATLRSPTDSSVQRDDVKNSWGHPVMEGAKEESLGTSEGALPKEQPGPNEKKKKAIIKGGWG